MKFLKYNISIFMSVIGLILSFSGGIYIVFNHKYIDDIYLGGGILLIGIFLTIFMKGIRIKTRQNYTFDEYGNNRHEYSSMSQQDRKVVDLAIMAENQTILSEAEYKSMIKPGAKNPDKALEDLIGLVQVKEKIAELKAQMEYTKRKDRHAYHLCFLGNPGTGKTTVAKIFTGFLYKYGYLKRNEYVYTDASSIMTGNSAKKMKLILNKSHGKVLFIDEAYALIFNNTGEGQQILALLLNEMENSRNNLTVILAGYKDQMRMLFQMNEGLQSRINTFLFFEDYDQHEMGEILKIMAAQSGYTINNDAYNYMVNILLYKKCLPTFSNGRTVRKLYEKTLNKHYLNLQQNVIDKSMRFTITYQDVVDDDSEDDYLLNNF